MRRQKGYYSISAVAKMFSVHQQTIRLYERQGLINPQRSEGNTRLFGEDDINRLEEVIYLTHELGINLAGVEMILKLKKQIARLQKNMNKAFESTQRELDKKIDTAKEQVQTKSKQLIQLRNGKRNALPALSQKPLSSIAPAQVVKDIHDDDDASWKIDYEYEQE